MAWAYVGGKFRQAKWIESFMPRTMESYVEVFGGAYWNFLKGSFICDRAYYNDVNRFNANLMACCAKYQEFSKYVDAVEPQDEKTFNLYRAEILSLLGTEFEMPNFDIGQKYVYLVTQIFSGIMSNNAKMVDLKGKYKSKYLSFADKLHNPKFQRRFDIIESYNKSYEEFIPMVDAPGTFLYVDPPYYGTENLYAFHEFSVDNHVHLAGMMKECQSKWILSYYDFPELSEWYPRDKYRWEFKEYKKASMAQDGKKQSVGTEVLVMNY